MSEVQTKKSGLLVTAIIVVILAALTPYINDTYRSLSQELLKKQLQVSVVEDFLKDPDFIAKVNNKTLWEACDKITSASESRFWYYPENEPNNIFEELTVKIYKDTPYWKQATAYEYWCNINDSSMRSGGVVWHTDRDEEVLAREHKLVFPIMGAVFYGYNETYEGGDFHIIDSIAFKRGSRSAEYTDRCDDKYGFCVSNYNFFSSNLANEALFVNTKFNTLLYANVTHFHKADRVLSGRRYALAVNANGRRPKNIEQAPSDDEMAIKAKGPLGNTVKTYESLSIRLGEAFV